jgi:cysteinyl-tRNA synthetase
MDLKFPHHECEIAQAEASNDQAPVRYWLHANMLTLNGKKMSKYTGKNSYPNELFNGTSDLISKAYSPPVVRFFMLQAHYTSILDLSDQALQSSEKGYHRLMEGVRALDDLGAAKNSTGWDVQAWAKECLTAMNDNFNTPILIAVLFEGVKQIQQIRDGKVSLSEADLQFVRETLKAYVFDVLGLQMEESVATDTDLVDGLMDLIIDLRTRAREDRDFGTSDQIRDHLGELGIQLKDSRDGTTYERKPL